MGENSELEGDKMRLWRYLDLAKYASLIQKGELHCPRGDQFDDKFEGSYPAKNKGDFEGSFNGEDWKKFVIISCWHKNKHESDAMWRLYGLIKHGVAIVTSEELLQELADKHGFYIEHVKYIEFKSEEAEIYIPTDIFHYKREAFEHESEVRMIKTRYPHNGFTRNMPNISTPVLGKEFSKQGMLLDVDLNKFISKIIVSPYAESWFYDVVQNMTKSCGVDVNKLSQSELLGDPIYPSAVI